LTDTYNSLMKFPVRFRFCSNSVGYST